MDIMGWTEARMLSRYQHVVDELRHDAARRMGAALWGDTDQSAGGPSRPSSGPGSGPRQRLKLRPELRPLARPRRPRTSSTAPPQVASDAVVNDRGRPWTSTN
jgi:hypothetical protein